MHRADRHGRVLARVWFLILFFTASPAWAPPPIQDDGMDWCGAESDHWLFREPLLATSRLWIRLEDFAATANRFLDYAALSELSYERKPDACTTRAPEPDTAIYRLCRAIYSRGWRSVTHEYPPKAERVKGFAYSVWERRGNANRPSEVIIAFRGTDDFWDWLSNFRPVTRLFIDRDQYDDALETAIYVSDLVQKSAPDARISLTGHSLGGGLAQFVLYSAPERFYQAVVFNTSSVTGYLDPDQYGQRRQAYCRCDSEIEPRIYRVVERGEILGAVRGYLPLTRNTYHLSLNLYGGNPIGQHVMRDMALALLDAAQETTGGRHWVQQPCLDELMKLRSASCAKPDWFGLTCPR